MQFFAPLLLLLLSAASQVQAAIYQCTDATGKTAYQGQPCAPTVAKQQLVQADTPPSAKEPTKAPTEGSFDRDQFVGTWCFFRQELDGETTEEFVTILLNANSSYIWSEGEFKQEGKWSYRDEDHELYLSDVGTHTVLAVSKSKMQLKRYSNMLWRAGSC